ncbi:hypothetical protein OUZ56_022869 [Daphnia magna]|uniref:Uncharacterized protein n=1 Tax=Daphnia magna TaxID=35525 RepID=A0ABR0AXZ8_9CRUS|nr:hypothetical protein OUZ56_022869 [Daphnia magna]
MPIQLPIRIGGLRAPNQPKATATANLCFILASKLLNQVVSFQICVGVPSSHSMTVSPMASSNLVRCQAHA